MSTNDVLQLGPYKYNVLKREGNRVLLSWTETTGIYREMWMILKRRIA